MLFAHKYDNYDDDYNKNNIIIIIFSVCVFTGNLDRHHYETLSDFDNFTMLLQKANQDVHVYILIV